MLQILVLTALPLLFGAGTHHGNGPSPPDARSAGMHPAPRASSPAVTLIRDKRGASRRQQASSEDRDAATKSASAMPAGAKSAAAAAQVASQPQSWPETEVADALRHCLVELAPLKAEIDTLAPIRSAQCGLPAPIRLKRIGAEPVAVEPAAMVNCRVAKALAGWLSDVVQPAARSAFGSPVVRLAGTEGYVCRNRNGAATAPISEHAFGNAIDILAFVLADGRKIDVLTGWGVTQRDTTPADPHVAGKQAAAGARAGERSGLGMSAPPKTAKADEAPKPQDQRSAFLKAIHAGACGRFGTVLGPEANEAHRNHLHLDLKPRARKAFCE